MKKLLAVLLSLLMVVTMCGCQGENEPNDTGEKTAAQVQKEILAGIEPDVSVTGKLVVYSPNSNGEINAIRPGFTTKYPNVTLEIVSLGTGDCLSRIQAEAENPQCDVMWGGMNTEKWFNNQGLWENYISPNAQNLPEEYRNNTGDSAGYFTNYGLSGNTAFVINTAVLEGLGLKLEDITGYQSLVDHADKLKGHVLSGDPVKSSSAWQELVAMLYIYGGGQNNDWKSLDMDKGWAYVEKFVEVIDGSVLSSSSAVYKNVTAGEAAIGVTYEDPALQLLKDEAPDIAMIYPAEGNNWTPCAAAIVKNAPHMDLAKLFIDFLVSTEGQNLYTCTTLRPADATMTNIVKGIKTFAEIPNVFLQDELYIASNTKDWRAKWTELMDAYNAKK
ncbi:MAG: extracellular solute-binding protein [Erysipelotrichaceae bacterium]|nr:extracellular solute-binding protein [Erysipelotrichaceae bacterium]